MNQRLKAIHKNDVHHPLEPVNFADGRYSATRVSACGAESTADDGDIIFFSY